MGFSCQAEPLPIRRGLEREGGKRRRGRVVRPHPASPKAGQGRHGRQGDACGGGEAKPRPPRRVPLPIARQGYLTASRIVTRMGRNRHVVSAAIPSRGFGRASDRAWPALQAGMPAVLRKFLSQKCDIGQKPRGLLHNISALFWTKRARLGEIGVTSTLDS